MKNMKRILLKLSGEALAKTILKILKNPEKLQEMESCSKKIGIADACETIYMQVKKLTSK